MVQDEKKEIQIIGKCIILHMSRDIIGSEGHVRAIIHLKVYIQCPLLLMGDIQICIN